MPSAIEITGVKELERKIGRLRTITVLTPPIVRSLALLNRWLSAYPTASKKKQEFKTDKQRRYFFWALKKGLIQVPYVRTFLLSRSWEMRVNNTGQTLEGVINNTTPYGPYVQGPDMQSSYHAGTWKTTDAIAEQHKDAIVRDFQAAIAKELAR